MEKLHYYVAFTKAYPFIIGLIFILCVVDYTLGSVLVTYLNDEWTNLGLQRAIQIVNLREGLTMVAEFIGHVLDVYIGRFYAVLGLTGLYVVGLVMLLVLDPHEMKHLKMLYLAILFISLGKAANESLKSFVHDQLREKENDGQVNEERVERRAQVWWFLPWIFAACLAPFLIASWDSYKILLTVALFVELLGFCSGKPLQAFEYTQTNSPATKVYYIVRAAILKRSLSYSMSFQGFYENTGYCMGRILPDVGYLRWLHKAAIIDRSMSVEEQVNNKLLYKVAEVEEVQYVLQPTAYSLTLLLYSITQASGTTFYLDQAQKLNKDFPFIIFLIIKIVLAYIVSNLWANIRTISLINIGMVFGLLSSLAALGVEAYEMHTRKTFSTHINVWWMTPQFIFLGLMEGFLVSGMERFTGSDVSESMGLFGSNLREFVIGVGRILNLGIVSIGVIYSSDYGRFYYYGLLGCITLGNSVVTTLVSKSIIEPNPIRKNTNHESKGSPQPKSSTNLESSQSSPLHELSPDRICNHENEKSAQPKSSTNLEPPRSPLHEISPDRTCHKSPEVGFSLLPPVIICTVCGMVMSDGQRTKNYYHLDDCSLKMS